MKVEVDVATCVASGQCVLVASEVFDQRDEDGIVVLLDETPAPGLRNAVQEAVMVCPATAIRLVEP